MWRRKKHLTLAELHKPFFASKERKFQEWLADEIPRRVELQGAHVALQRFAFEQRDKSPAFKLAQVMVITTPEGKRFKAAVDNMREGRALEFKNVRFRKPEALKVTATVQVTAKSYTNEDAIEALAHAESIYRELRKKWIFRRATLFSKPIFMMAFEAEPKDMRRDQVYYRKVGKKIEKLSVLP